MHSAYFQPLDSSTVLWLGFEVITEMLPPSKVGVVLAVSLAASLLASCSPAPFSGSGTMSAPDRAYNHDESDRYETDVRGSDCNRPNRDNKYPDIQEGTSVTLRDSTGAIVALSRLDSGSLRNGWVEEETYGGFRPAVDDVCVYKFMFEEIDSSDEFFSVEVGNRGEVQVSRSNLEIGLVGLSLG